MYITAEFNKIENRENREKNQCNQILVSEKMNKINQPRVIMIRRKDNKLTTPRMRHGAPHQISQTFER